VTPTILRNAQLVIKILVAMLMEYVYVNKTLLVFHAPQTKHVEIVSLRCAMWMVSASALTTEITHNVKMAARA
jgi:hypothetical protein